MYDSKTHQVDLWYYFGWNSMSPKLLQVYRMTRNSKNV